MADSVPKVETGASRFLQSNPEYDGRGVTVAVFDTGVDPGAAHLRTTSQGLPKVVDIVDCTGSGDVTTTATAKVASGGKVVGLSGRTLVIPEAWAVAEGTEVRLGLKPAFELFPSKLSTRVKGERKKPWQEKQLVALAAVREELSAWDTAHPSPSLEQKAERQVIQAKLDALVSAESNFNDPGPVYDCLLVKDDKGTWRAAVDVSATGDLSQTKLLADYKLEQQYGTFSDMDRMNYSVKIYDNGNILSIVCTADAHGTHVAGIVAAHDPANPDRHGIAPGAQIVSLKIGDSRLNAMESGTGLVRALIACLENNCDLINMSFGEGCCINNVGRFVQLAEEIVTKHNVIFVAAAGNHGPALSTVICPGGTNSSIIGVGAWVSKAMMAKAYSLRDAPADMQYTWSSRGPSTDGDLGVSISAPGAAITSVPEWTLAGGQLMNGTSMASPNACGGIALILSALKAEKVTYTPHSIRRALENTAINPGEIASFDHGHGLLQVDKAFEHAKTFSAGHDTGCDFAVSTSCRGQNGRGVYLRESGDVFSHDRIDASVTVTPTLHEDAPSQDRIGFDITCSLSASKPWVHCPDHLVLKHGARTFSIQVDVASLPEGASFAEVLGVPTGKSEQGPLFRVPVTVIKPREVVADAETKLEKLEFSPGAVHRVFVRPPSGATWVNVAIKGLDFNGTRLFALHVQQLVQHRRYTYANHTHYPRVSKGEQWRCSIPIQPDATIEVALGQWWASLENSLVDLTLDFEGVTGQDVELHSAENVARMDVSTPLVGAELAPSAKLSTWCRVIAPTAPGTIKPLPDDRDLLPNGRRIYELVLEYKIQQKDKAEVRPVVPVLSTVLYESSYESQLWILFDSNKQRIACGDAFPHQYKTTIGKGDYVLRLQIRHDQTSTLEKLKSQPIYLEQTLKDALTVDVYDRSPVMGGSKVSNLSLTSKTSRPLYFVGPSLDALSPQPGDFLTGEITLLKDESKKKQLGKYNIRLNVGPAGPKQAASSPAPDPTKPTCVEEAVRDVQIEWLAKTTDEDKASKLFSQLLAEFPDHLPLYDANLTRSLVPGTGVDPLTSLEHNRKIVAAADLLLLKIEPDKLALHYGVNLDPNNTAAAAERTKMDKIKETLVRALFQKCVALTRLVRLAGGQATGPIQVAAFLPGSSIDLDTLHDTVTKLKQWADLAAAPERLKWFCEYECGCGRTAVALQTLNKMLFAAEPKNATKELWQTRDAMHAALGWNHLIDDNSVLAKFPPAYAPF